MLIHCGSRGPARRSYTLVELIIVMAVLALAAAILVPHMVGRDTMMLQSAIRLMISDLSFAQSDALANQEFRRMVFYDDGRGYCLIVVPTANYTTPLDLDDPTVEYVYDPLGRMGQYKVDFSADKRFEGVTITAANLDGVALADRPEITYDALGGTIISNGDPGLGGTIVISFDDQSYQITVSPFTGKLTVSEV